MEQALLADKETIIAENKKDIVKGKKNGLSQALLDRLTLTESRIEGMAKGLQLIEQLPDPIGEVIGGWTRPNGLKISKIRVPLGVIGIIYEARPNVTVDVTGLTLKSGNSVVLRGSSSAIHSNLFLVKILKKALSAIGIPDDVFQLIEESSHESVLQLVKMKKYLSLIIPRGGADLIQSVVDSATVPTLETGIGNCHVYVDKDADLTKAEAIVLNAKVQRPSVCNACETLLVHEKIAAQFLPSILLKLQEKGVEIRGCPTTKTLFSNSILATEEDWATEYLDLILAVKIVTDAEQAIHHIARYGTLHSEAIISENFSTIQHFIQQVDAAAIMVNASTRFTDGEEFGFGAEMGISTQKLHARGPVGLPELTTYKYVVEGSGHIRI